jgi:hypothetical protein
MAKERSRTIKNLRSTTAQHQENKVTCSEKSIDYYFFPALLWKEQTAISSIIISFI